MNTRTLGAQMCEVEVAFPFPQPGFWQPLRGGAKKKDVEKRRFPRVTLPRGMSIAWKTKERHDISRVKSISLGGLFIEAAEPARMGDTIQVQFDIPGGAVPRGPWSGARSRAREWELSSRNCRRELRRSCTSFCRSCSETCARNDSSGSTFSGGR